MNDDDPINRAAEALTTAIGTDETLLRQKLGNEGYEEWKRNQEVGLSLDVLTRSSLVEMQLANARVQTAHAKLAEARATFWFFLSLAVLVGTVCGAVEFVRWAVLS